MADDGARCVVVDNGSGTIKAGFAGTDTPSAVISSVVGSPHHESSEEENERKMKEENEERSFVGTEAKWKREILDLKYPLEHGVVTDWDAMEKLWHHIFHHALQVNPEDHPILLTEPPPGPKPNREKMTQLMFETFKTPAMNLSQQPVLSLYSSGRKTGFVVDSGDGVTHFTSIYEGTPFSEYYHRLEIGGRDLTNYMLKLLSERGYSLATTAENESVCAIKEKLSSVALDFEKETQNATQEAYELPDGQLITLEKERFRCPEALFQPSFLGIDSPGIHQLCYNSINRCDIDYRYLLFSGIVLAGGNSMFSRIGERLQNELMELFPRNTKLQVDAPSNRMFSAWCGGAVLGSLGLFQDMLVKKEEYDEWGPEIVNQKCF